jgi:hypothetical protein
LSQPGRFQNRRARAAISTAVVFVALAAAGVLVGVGVANSSLRAFGADTTTTVPTHGKVTICHKTHSRKHPQVTITISVSAWPAHERHGDTLGPCTTTTTTTTTSTTTTTTSAPTSSARGKSGEQHGKSGSSHGKHH